MVVTKLKSIIDYRLINMKNIKKDVNIFSSYGGWLATGVGLDKNKKTNVKVIEHFVDERQVIEISRNESKFWDFAGKRFHGDLLKAAYYLQKKNIGL